MPTRQTHFLSEITSAEAISEGTLAYLGQRTKNRLYNYVVKKFLEREKDGFTRADLARKIGRRPEVITRWLGAPGNWRIETVAHLLAGICAEELEPHSLPFAGRPPRNFRGDEWSREANSLSSSESGASVIRVKMDNNLDHQSAVASKPKIESQWVKHE